MAEQATMSTNVKLMPLSGSDEIKLLCKSQQTAYFEKILSASSVYSDYRKGPSTLTLPAWFVEEHGDKIRKSVILRSASFTKSWTVNLSICFKNPTITQVRFAGGWRAFAVSNGLSRGDSLIFALTAVSEFEVYVFRGKSGILKEFPSQPPRSWSKDSELARKKAKQSRKQLAAEGDVNGAVKSNALIAETKMVRDSKKNLISASSYSPSSCRFSFHGNAIESGKARDSSPRDHCGHESAEDQNELEVKCESATTYGPAQRTRARAKHCSTYGKFQASALGQILCDTQHPAFFKKPTASNFFRP